MMNYQNATLLEEAVKVGSTPAMTEKTVVPGIWISIMNNTAKLQEVSYERNFIQTIQ
jgi:hypothetical protein